MYLTHLLLRHFRNYGEQQIDFAAPKTILVGENAQGKSNLLEAVELLATLKSHRTSRDRDLVQQDQPVAQITASVRRDLGVADLSLVLRQAGRRTAILNGEKLRRQLDFLGALNAVQFSSLDLDLVRGGPGGRRDWLDTLLIQLEPVYAHILSQYNQVLKQRNALIKKSFGDDDGEPAPALDATEFALWDAQLAALGTRVIRRRARAIDRLAPIAHQWHQAISGQREDLRMHYQPNVPMTKDDPQVIQASFLEKIKQRAIAEQHQRTTLVGPHRDDIEFTINDTPSRQYGSQGQQRTLVLALKLAELHLIDEVVGEPPLLLLDDVLAELDLNRQNQLLEAIQDRFQTIITTTHLGAFGSQWMTSSQILTVKAGQIEGN
ncbi:MULTISPECIES: DNA replication/repair protein RecF [Cyanophyceae]|uniref:DNA replication/repair protein RecF n=1 Tax=Cyanophyceae TaxID=3028117 RepID=UPI0016865C34|nr:MULTISPECIES: DNA replication/repair protein RecF [Cyanophyceae]MBD1915887.1 DNA replication/repair protein RecF [Phormidium sp. FACHB-77]MBD2030439.1 DNA replication/repair protein RecF [Phormidium sp. FACHB-322]MBD2053441.1 DNA replication/repair protein RecF [Leptolyngbya sp. FACHB-60]